jgi:hypothetical protein
MTGKSGEGCFQTHIFYERLEVWDAIHDGNKGDRGRMMLGILFDVAVLVNCSCNGSPS